MVGFATTVVELGIGMADPLGTESWTDASAYWKQITINRGRSNELDQFSAGEASIVFDNQTFAFDPDNGSSALGGPITPLTPVRVSMRDSTNTVQMMFYGYVRPRGGLTFNDTADGRASTATINAVDFMGVLSTWELAAPVPGAAAAIQTPLGGTGFGSHFWDQQKYLLEAIRKQAAAAQPPAITVPWYCNLHSGEQLAALVAGDPPDASMGSITPPLPSPVVGWDIDDGQTLVQPYFGAMNALQFVQTMAQTEGGTFWVSKSGSPTFEERYAVFNDHGTSRYTFDDAAGSSLKYAGYQKDYAVTVYNDIQLTPAGQTMIEVSDSSSITAYTKSTYSLSGLFMNDSAEAKERADWFLAAYKDPIVAPTQLTVYPRRNTTTLDAALKLELRDRVTVKRKPPAAGAQITTDVFIQHISHTLQAADRSFSTTFQFDPAARFGFATAANFLHYDGADTYDATKVWGW